MSNYWELMLMYSDRELGMEDALKIEKTISENKDLKKGYLLNRQIDELMRVHLMMEQIKADPEHDNIELSAKLDVAKSIESPDNSNNGLVFYINGSIADSKSTENLINESEREMYHKGIDNETSRWVQMWKEESVENSSKDKYTLEIASYIKRGMEETISPQIGRAKRETKRKLIYRISAVAAILILAFGIWGIFGPKSTPDDLFSEYYKPYNIIDGQTRSYKQTDEQFVEIMRIYKAGQYNNVTLKLKSWIKKDNNSPKILLIYGIAQIEQHNYENAIFIFNEILKDGGEFSIEAKWYLALCYLKIKNNNKAKDLLRDLSKTPGIYKDMAIELLDEL
jgi:hypothetical protein